MSQIYYPVKSAYVRVGMWINGLLYTPECDAECRSTAVLCMHSDGDYFTFPAGQALASHGYPTLCANVSRAQMPLDKKLDDVRQCIEYLKSLSGVENVVILGHSGGATLMSCYQATAENGAEYFQGSEKIIPMGDVGPLPAADGVMIIDSNWGNGTMTLLSLDPAVKEEGNGVELDPEYDLSSEANGYAHGGACYNENFVKKYLYAQHKRNNRLIDGALERLEAINSGKGSYRDDEPWLLTGGNQMAPNNRLFPQDIRYLSHTRGEWPLIHADGSVSVGVVPSLRKPRGAKSFTGVYGMGTAQLTVKQYLASNCVRTTDDFGYDETHVYGVDWDSSFCCTPGNVKGIHSPMLIMGMTGGYEFLAAECIYENAAAEDKTLAFVEGASHMLVPARDCEEYPGQFGDTVKNIFDFAADWLEKRFS